MTRIWNELLDRVLGINPSESSQGVVGGHRHHFSCAAQVPPLSDASLSCQLGVHVSSATCMKPTLSNWAAFRVGHGVDRGGGLCAVQYQQA